MFSKLSLLNFFQRKLLGYEVEVMSFSQAGEDLLIRNFFYKRLSSGEKGFYVDVGAYHPYRHSNTYYLYRCGWHGINIDPAPGSMDQFKKFRPRDINLEVAVAAEEGTLDFYYFGKESTLNTISKEYIAELGNLEKLEKIIKVPARNLKSIFSEYVPVDREIDFLNIDIEGFELNALGSNDWGRFRPKLIAAEIYGYSTIDISNAEVTKFLTERGYEYFTRIILSVPNVNTVFFIDSKQDKGLWKR